MSSITAKSPTRHEANRHPAIAHRARPLHAGSAARARGPATAKTGGYADERTVGWGSSQPRSPGRMRGDCHPAVHDAPQQLPAQISLGGIRVLVAGAATCAVSGVHPVQPPHRRWLRGRRFAVAARAVPARGPLSRSGRFAPGAGGRAARRRHLCRHERRRRPARAGGQAVPSISVVPNPAQPAPAPDRPYVVSLRLDFNNTGAVDVARQLRQKIGSRATSPARPRTAGSGSTSSARARWGRRRRPAPSTTSPPRSAGTCRSS
jgi:hypothetical protein